MPETQQSVFANIEHQIRSCVAPNNPTLLHVYTCLGEEYATYKPVDEQIALHVRIFNTLIDTMCDSTLPHHWRCLCLDFLYRPLRTIERVALTRQQLAFVRKLYSEMQTLSYYFMQHSVKVTNDV